MTSKPPSRPGLLAGWRQKLSETPQAGFGQSIWDDLRFLWRYRRCRRLAVAWRRPSDDERHAIDSDPILGRFGDMTQLVADVGGQRWIVRDRDWWGWPDPPRYVLFVLEEQAIHVAWDFNHWPGAWQPDPGETDTGA